MSKHQIPKRIRKNTNHISSSIIVLQINNMTCREISELMSPQTLAGFVKDPAQILPRL